MIQEALDRKERRMAAVTKEDVDEVLAESIEQRVTPYGHHSYEEQLKLKHDDLKGMLQVFNTNIDKEIKRKAEPTPNWYKNNPVMPLVPEIIHSDMLEGYRNKVEFTVGRQYAPPREGKDELWSPGPICVGFNRGNLAKGISFVE